MPRRTWGAHASHAAWRARPAPTGRVGGRKRGTGLLTGGRAEEGTRVLTAAGRLEEGYWSTHGGRAGGRGYWRTHGGRAGGRGVLEYSRRAGGGRDLFAGQATISISEGGLEYL